MSEHSVVRHDLTEPRSFEIGLWILALTILLVLSFISTWFFYRSRSSQELNLKEQTPVPIALQQLRNYEQQELNSVKWLNQNEDKIQIPIQQAMELVIRDYSQE